MARFSKRATKKSLRKRTSKKGSRKIRKLSKKRGGQYNPLAQFQKKSYVKRREQGPAKDFLSQNMGSVTDQSNQNVAQDLRKTQMEQMRLQKERDFRNALVQEGQRRKKRNAYYQELRNEERRKQEEEELRNSYNDDDDDDDDYDEPEPFSRHRDLYTLNPAKT
jgi:hypothetical protein